MNKFGLRAIAVGAVALILPGLAHAGNLAHPSGDVILTVTGKIGNVNAPGAAEFDVEMLQELGLTTLRTSTAWTSGQAVFEGVLARDLLAAVDAKGDNVEASAINDYAVSIPLTEIRHYDVLLALRMNGQELSVKDKGPVWVVYPRDQHSELQDPSVDKKWIWQLTQLHVD